MSIVEVEEGRSSRCGKTTKGIAQDETGMSYQERNAGNKKKVKESKEEKGDMYGLTAKDTAKRVKKEFRGCLTRKGTRESVPEEVHLLELGQCIREVIVTYIEYERCRQKGCHVEENRGQGVILNRQRQYGCQRRKEKETACD